MTADVVTVEATTPIRSYVDTIRARRFSGLPVVDGDGKPVGVVSHTDVLRGLVAFITDGGPLSGDLVTRRRVSSKLMEALMASVPVPRRIGDYLDQPVRSIMVGDVISCAPDTPLREACALMTSRHIHRLLVLDGDRIAGILSATDVVRHVAGVPRAV